MDVDPIPLRRGAVLGRTVLHGVFIPSRVHVIRPLNQIGPILRHGPCVIDNESFSGWHEFPGAAIEYLSPALTERLCALWAEPTDWVRMRCWIEGVQLSAAEFALRLETRWAGDALEELRALKLLTYAHQGAPV